MAKGQKKSNREIRKPKTIKAPAAATTAELFSKGLDAPAAPKKKAR